MPAESIGENPSVTLQSNRLKVNGAFLRADVLKHSMADKIPVSPDELTGLLIPERRPLLRAIEQMYVDTTRSNPDSRVVRPSIWTAQLANTTQTDGKDSQVFTEKGYSNGGVNRIRDEIQPRFLGHWDAITEAGFMPEVRRSSTKEDAGAWLLLRKPTLDEVALHWFDFPSDTETNVELIRDDDIRLEAYKLWHHHLDGEAIVDQVPNEHRSRLKIGLILSTAAIKSALGDSAGYDRDIDDAFDFLDRDPTIPIRATRAVENATFELGM